MLRHLLSEHENPEKIAVIENDKAIKYSELKKKAETLQSALRREHRETAAVLLPNSGDYIAAVWGLLASGITVFPLNVLMTEHEIVPLLEHAQIKTVVTSTVFRRFFDKAAVFDTISLKIIYMEEMDTNYRINKFTAQDISPDELMLLLNTSGTTEKQKIVKLSEKNVETSVLGYLKKLRFDKENQDNIRYTLAAPFSSVYGVMILSACLIKSFPVVILNGDFTLDLLYKTTEKHRITHYEGSTSAILLMEQMIGKHIPYDISTLTYFGTGGSMVSGNTIEKLQTAYKGKEFFHGYGMTEASPLITKHPQRHVKKTESVGTAIDGIEIAVETDSGITCDPYSKGEIIVKGHNVMLGYYNNDSATKQALKNGYLYTGDIGYLDEEGYLYLCGRKKNIIIVRGFKVHPEEVEECILSSLLAKDCFVHGQPDEFGNETVYVDIVPAHSKVRDDDIRMYCAEHLADYKQPRKINFCESVKKNLSGKTERRKESF